MTALIVNPDNSRIPGVTYYLANTSDTPYFNIDPNTGRVYVINSPDREIQQTYQVRPIFGRINVNLIQSQECQY